MDDLYHYCPSEAFRSIVTKKNLRLSSLSLSNDHLEGEHIISVINNIIEESSLDAVDKKRLFDAAIPKGRKLLDGLGVCFSKEGDQLGQWRGYADDGHGFSIGFNAELLRVAAEKALISLFDVKYELSDQRELIRRHVETAIGFARSGGLMPPVRGLLSGVDDPEYKEQAKKAYSSFQSAVGSIASAIISSAYRIKNESFREEKEWRLLKVVPLDFYEKCEFFARRSTMVPYVEFQFSDIPSIISVVRLGPKNTTPIDVVRGLLASCGFGDARVENSASSYR